MMLRETAMQIKYLARQGMQKTKIADWLGISRQTVYNHLDWVEPYPKPRKERPSKLDPFRDYIRARLEKFDLPSTTLLRELRTRGYEGGLTILRDFVSPLNAEFVRRVTERFETLPGQQAQIDWGECGTIIVDGERRKLYAFVMVLGYSRMMYARFTTSTRLPVLLGCVSRAFEALGMPAELLVDNMKQAVDQQDVSTGTVRWNSQFLDFVEHFGVLPVASPPYWPRVKGKVERGPEKGATAYVYGGSEYTYGCRKLLMKPGWVPRLEGLHRRTLEKSAGLSPLKSALWHAYRRKWANERKHLPPADVAEMGGWSCTTRCATRAKTSGSCVRAGTRAPRSRRRFPSCRSRGR